MEILWGIILRGDALIYFMALRYYFDTSIWMDFYEDRKDFEKDLGYYAFKLLMRINDSGGRIIATKMVFYEISLFYPDDKIRGMTNYFKDIIDIVEITDEERIESENISNTYNIPFGDALHAVAARDNDAILITRDRHFEKLRHICRVMKPEDLI